MAPQQNVKLPLMFYEKTPGRHEEVTFHVKENGINCLMTIKSLAVQQEDNTEPKAAH